MLKRVVKGILEWVGYFLWVVGLTVGIGSVVGGVLFMVFGKLFGDYGMVELLKKGAWVGFRYAGVWAGGVGLVGCYMRGYRLGQERRKVVESE